VVKKRFTKKRVVSSNNTTAPRKPY
jgi:hypothetical protein